MTATPDFERAADTVRAWALDENLKQRVLADPALAAMAGRIARRYTAGDTIGEAVDAARAGLHRTPDDLPRVLRHPGTVRLVKGAFLEPDAVAHRR